MKVWNSFKIAFAMYSKIPMGTTEWKEESMRYSMCFVPWIGMLIGALQVLWFELCIKLQFNNVMYACMAALLPLLVTGGIHMDGFCDVVDALSSYGDVKKKLEILKDPHVGAFAVLWTCGYFVAQVGFFSEIYTLSQTVVVALGYVLSRALTCMLSMFLKNARRDGTLYAFSSQQEHGIVSTVLAIYVVLSFAAMAICCRSGAVLVFLTTVVMVFWFCRMADRNFGGITGDLAGFLIQMMELYCLIGVVIARVFD